jgi:hypothetical protein
VFFFFFFLLLLLLLFFFLFFFAKLGLLKSYLSYIYIYILIVVLPSLSIAFAICQTGQLVSMDMVEVNSSLGDEKQVAATAEMAVDLIKSALGKRLY